MLLHLGASGLNTVLTLVYVLAGVGSGVLLALALAGFFRRRTRSYLLIMLALAALTARTAIGGLAMLQVLAGDPHHLFEHGLDVLIALLLIAAIYRARTTPQEVKNLQ